jgi:hypothetical protein
MSCPDLTKVSPVTMLRSIARGVEQGYWQSAIAAKPSAAHTGYLMGGLMWFCIPFTLATTMGLATLALDLPVTLAEAGSGEIALTAN